MPKKPKTPVTVPHTTITVDTHYGYVSIGVEERDMDMDSLVNSLFRPLVLAMGYHPDTVNEYFGEPT